MFIVLVAYLLLLVSDATVVLDVNATVGEAAVLPCILTTTTVTDLKTLRFYWQDERNDVLYSFNEGKEMPAHVNEVYRDRITAFPQDMIRGNISVKVKNLTLDDNQKVFQAFAAVLIPGETRRYSLEHRKICQITFHLAVPYKSVSLAVNEETRTAVCTTQRGFPMPLVKWRLQLLSDNSQRLLDPRDVYTTAEQDPKDQLYNFSSTIEIPGGPYRSVTCFVHNPTLNVTLITTHILNKGTYSNWSPRRGRRPSSSPDCKRIWKNLYTRSNLLVVSEAQHQCWTSLMLVWLKPDEVEAVNRLMTMVLE